MLLAGPVDKGSWWGNDRRCSQQNGPGCVLKFEFHPSVNGSLGRVKGKGGTWSDLCSRTTPHCMWRINGRLCVFGGREGQPGSDGGRGLGKRLDLPRMTCLGKYLVREMDEGVRDPGMWRGCHTDGDTEGGEVGAGWTECSV